MTDYWQLILHHSYSGAPGLVYDNSQLEGAHGVAVGAVEFHDDGLSPDSGSISIHQPNSAVHVEATTGWGRLGAVRVEVACKPSPGLLQNFFYPVIDCSRLFHMVMFQTDDQPEHVQPLVVLRQTTAQRVALVSSPVPVNQWVTVGFEYDGLSQFNALVNGAVTRSKSVAIGPLPGAAPAAVQIGGELPGRYVSRQWFQGRIDDVKVWRRNPLAVSEDFLNRPMDPETAQCWARWGRQLQEWLRKNPRCAEELAASLEVIRGEAASVTGNRELSERFRRIAEAYRTEWRKGRLTSDRMISALVEGSHLLNLEGMPAVVDVEFLMATRCWRSLATDVPAPLCDSELIGLFDSATAELTRGDRNCGTYEADGRNE